MMDEYMKAISDSLFDILAKTGWSITQAADFCGISRRLFHDLMNGGSKGVRSETFVRISEGTGRTVSSLIGIEDKKNDKSEELLDKIYREISFHMRKGGAV